MKISWDELGDRRIESGLDRGVLYTNTGAVPWNGLVQVQKNVSGGDAERLWYDGRLYMIDIRKETFTALVEAITYPPEFENYQGKKTLAPGLFAEFQRRKFFDLSWRTGLGDGVVGLDLGYKLHLVWNAVALPAVRTNRTRAATVDPENFQWTIEAKQPRSDTIEPTAYFSIDSTQADPTKLAALEDVLYGTDSIDASFPTQDEVVDILT